MSRSVGTLNESVLRTNVMDEGQPRANESGPLTILQPLKQGRRCDASMPTHLRAEHPASPSSQQRPPTEPVPLNECMDALLAFLLEREFTKNQHETTIHNAGKD